MSASFKVLAPYVTLNVTDSNGEEVVTGFYEGAVVDNAVDGEVLERHLRKGLVEKVSASKADAKPEPKSNR